jgi:hypothetical protein
MTQPDFIDELRRVTLVPTEQEAENLTSSAVNIGMEPAKVGRVYDVSTQTGVSRGALVDASDLTLRHIELGNRRREALRDKRVADWIARDAIHAAVSGNDAENLAAVNRQVDELTRIMDSIPSTMERMWATAYRVGPARATQVLAAPGHLVTALGEFGSGLVEMDQQRTFRRMFPRASEEIPRPRTIAATPNEWFRERRQWLEEPLKNTLPLFFDGNKRAIEEFDERTLLAAYKPFGIDPGAFTQAIGEALIPLAAARHGFRAVMVTGGFQSGLRQFGQMRDEGHTDERAYAGSIMAGVVTATTMFLFQGGTERFAKYLAAQPNPTAAFREATARTVGWDIMDEMAEESVDQFIQEFAINGRSLSESIEAAFQAQIIGGFTGGFYSGAHYYSVRRANAVHGRLAAEATNATSERLAQTDTAKASKELTNEYILNQMPENANVYVKAEVLADLSEEGPAVQDELASIGADQEAIEQGGLIEVSVGDVMSRLSPSVREVVVQNMGTTPEAKTAQDDEDWNREEEGEIARGELEAEAQARRDYNEEFNRIVSETVKKFGITEEDARTQWTPLAANAWALFTRGSYQTPAELLRRVSVDRGAVEVLTEEQLGEPEGSIRKRFEQKERHYREVRPKGLVQIADYNYIVRAVNGAGPDTIAHETGHIMLEEIRMLVTSGRADESLASDWDAIKDFLGITSNADAIPLHPHEKFADALLVYLEEGNAPSVKLEPVFARFSRWITDIMRRAAATFGITLTPEMRGVFGRLLAADNEIQHYMAVNEITVPPDDAIGRIQGVGPAKRSRVRRLYEDARARIADAMQRIRARRMNALRREWRPEIRAEMAEEPLWIAVDLATKAGGLNVQTLGEDEALTELVREIRGRHRKLIAPRGQEGIEPHRVMEESGFATVTEMLVSMRDSLPVTQEVSARLTARELAEDVTPDTVEAVLESDEFLEAEELLAQYLHTANRSSQPRPERRALDVAARDAIASMVYGPIKGQQTAHSPHRFMAAALKALQAERRAFLRDDHDAAIKANTEFQEQMALGRASQEAVKTRDELRKVAKRTAKVKQGRQGGILYPYQQNAVMLAFRHGLVTEAQAAQFPPPSNPAHQTISSLLDPTQNQDIAEYDVRSLLADFIMDDGDTRPIREMTVFEVQELLAGIKTLVKRGRYLAGKDFGEENEDFNDVLAEIHSEERMGGLKSKSPLFSTRGGSLGKLGQWVKRLKKDIFGNLLQLDFVWRIGDGLQTGVRAKELDTEGPLVKHLMLASSKAARVKKDVKRRITSLIEGPQRQFLRTRRRLGVYPDAIKHIPLPTGFREIQGAVAWTVDDVLAIAANMGNPYNMEELAKGFGWFAEDGSPDVSRLYELTSVLDEADWNAIQQTWDAIDTLWPESARVFEDLFGRPPPKVEAVPLTITFKDGSEVTLKGGYFPIRFDTELSTPAAQQEEAASAQDLLGAMFMPTSVRRGHLMARKGSAGKPFLLNLPKVLSEHVTFATTFISHGKFARDASRLITNPDFAALAREKLGSVAYEEMMPWVRALAGRETEQLAVYDRAIQFARPFTALYVLGGRIITSAKNQTDAIGALWADVTFPKYALGTFKVALNPVRAFRFMMTNSDQQRERLFGGAEREFRNLVGKFDSLVSRFAKANRLAKVGQAISLSPVTFPGLLFEVPAWTITYDETFAETGDHELAVLKADAVVAASQPVTELKDLSRLQRSRKGVHTMFTLFMTPFIRRYNQVQLFWRAAMEGRLSVYEAISFSGQSFLLGAALPAMIGHAMWGQRDDEEDDEYMGRLYRDIAEEVVLYQVQGIPLSREAIRGLRALGERVGGVREPVKAFAPRAVTAPIVDAHKRALYALIDLPEILETDDDERLNAAVWDIADAMFVWTGIPVARIKRDLDEGIRQYEQENRDNAWLIIAPDPERRGR